jgi:hypothetical protein
LSGFPQRGLDAQILGRGGGFVRRRRLPVFDGKEVRGMKYYKITKTWSVKAESEVEAIKLVSAEPMKYLDSETITRTEYKKPQAKTGWGHTITQQLTGK